VISLLQRVRGARVEVAGRVVGSIDAGLLMFVCAEPADTPDVADRLVAKVLKLRIFADDAGKMNRSVADIGGGLLVVSQSRWLPTPRAATGRASARQPNPSWAAGSTSAC
jgi:D-tyrosyl-tRNA(Tyr) deacylase